MRSPTNIVPDIFVHVPKTAGTSLRSVIFQHYGPSNVWAYEQVADGLVRGDRQLFPNGDQRQEMMKRRLSKLPPAARQLAAAIKHARTSNPEQVFATAAAVVGHFPLDRYAPLCERYGTRSYTVVREPLSRMVSHYRHMQRYAGIADDLRGEWQRGFPPETSFAAFALHERNQNFQTAMTGNDPAAYDLVGTTERLPDFMLELGLLTAADSVPQLRQGGGRPATLPLLRDAGFIRDFQSFHAADYDFYNQVAARLPQPRSVMA